MGLFDESKEPTIFHLGVDDQASYYLLQTIKWKKFLGIIGIVMSAILVLAGIASIFGSMMVGNASGAYPGYNLSGMTMVYGVVILLMTLLYIYPIVCLLRFCSSMKLAITASDNMAFNTALMYQRNLWRFMGIMMIVILALYGVIILFSISRLI